MEKLLLLAVLSATATFCVADHNHYHDYAGYRRPEVLNQLSSTRRLVYREPVEPAIEETAVLVEEPVGPIGATAQGVVEGAETIIEAPLNLIP